MKIVTTSASIVLLLAACAVPEVSSACTRVLYAPEGHAVMVGRNMDWVEDMKTNLYVYPRGIARNGMDKDNSLQWVSQYGSIVATAYDLATTDGMNEKGFTAELNGMVSADFGARDKSVAAISILMWAQFYLDNFATVSEAVHYSENTPMQIVPVFMPQIKRYINLHLAIADASGDSAILEYIDGKLKIFHDRSYKVMTNDPRYDLQLENLKQYQGFGGDKALPGTTLPEDRFVRASFYVDHLPEPTSIQQEVAEVFSVLHEAEQPFGVPSPERPLVGVSIWRVVTDLTNHVYYFNSLLNFNTLWVNLDKFNLTAGAPVMKLDIVHNPSLSGDVTDKLKPL